MEVITKGALGNREPRVVSHQLWVLEGLMTHLLMKKSSHSPQTWVRHIDNTTITMTTTT